MWDEPTMTGRSWLELKARVFALLDRSVHRDGFGGPVFTSQLQARLIGPLLTQATA